MRGSGTFSKKLGLLLWAGQASGIRDADYPWAASAEENEEFSRLSPRRGEMPDAPDYPPEFSHPTENLEATRAFLADLRDQEAELDRVLATVLFTDILDSTATAAAMGDRAWRDVLERHHGIVRGTLGRFRGVEVDTAGDGFFATFDGPARAVRCAEHIIEAVRPLGIEIRAGVHTGECQTIDGKVGGLGVVIGARIGSRAEANQVLVSQTVKDLTAGSGLKFEDTGEHELKGVPDRWHLYRVMSGQS